MWVHSTAASGSAQLKSPPHLVSRKSKWHKRARTMWPQPRKMTSLGRSQHTTHSSSSSCSSLICCATGTPTAGAFMCKATWIYLCVLRDDAASHTMKQHSRQDFRQWSSPTQGQMAPDTRLCILPPSATISLVEINSLVSLFHPSHKAVHTAIHRQAKRLRFKTRSWYAADALG